MHVSAVAAGVRIPSTSGNALLNFSEGKGRWWWGV